MIVGTAGHIDHGKTALVKALTGVDADRLKEEKARGITIDLGFAYLPLPSGGSIGFVDVPGHERFVHTMLAGASGIDLALLVIAADDGVMPQTREHLAILDLLGIDRLVVALSKADLADFERREVVAAEIRAVLASTRFGSAAIVSVSTLTGEGLPDLRETLTRAETNTGVPRPKGLFRLAVDRSFTLAGVGTVVTGTVLSGVVEVGDRVVVSPSGLPARVRGLHAQNRPAERGVMGERCALNLTGDGIAKDAISRGDVVVDRALHAPTDRIDADFQLLPGEPKAIGTWFPARLHHASAEVGVRVVPLASDIAPGASGPVQLVLDTSLPAVAGDRYVLRDVSAQRTIGGGRFLDLRPPARKRRTPDRLAMLAACALGNPEATLVQLLQIPPFLVEPKSFARDQGLDRDEMTALLDGIAVERLTADNVQFLLASPVWDGYVAALRDILAKHHADHPEMQGLGRERLRLMLEPRLPPGAFAAALARLAESGSVAIESGFVRLASHVAHLSPVDEAHWLRVAPALGGEGRFRPPRVRDLAISFGLDEREVRYMLKGCGRLGRVDQIAPDHFFLRATTAEMVRLAAWASADAPEGWFTAATFRDLMDNGRKVAIQILDFFDRHGVTVRRGDLRRVNPHRLDLFGDHGRETFPVGRPDFKSGWGSEPAPGGFDSHSLPPTG